MALNVKGKFFASADFTLAVDIHPTIPWLLTGDSSGHVTISSPESGALIYRRRISSGQVWCVKFIARKNWYVLGISDGKVHIFDSTARTKSVFNAHTDAVRCLAVHPTASILLTGSWDNTIKAWNWDEEWSNIQTYQGHSQWINSIALNPKDPNTFASASDDGTVKMWSVVSPTPVFTIKAHSRCVNYVDFHPAVDQPYLVTASNDRTVKVWNYLSQSCVHTMTGHTSHVLFAIFHPSLPIIISGSWDGTVSVWNCETYGIEFTHMYECGKAWCIALCKEPSNVAVGFDDAVLILELPHSRPLQITVLRDDMSGGAPKAQVQKSLEGRDVQEPTTIITTDREHTHELVQSLDGLTTAYDTTLSLSPTPPSTTPQPNRVHQHKVDPYQQCTTLMLELMTDTTTNNLISKLEGDNAQSMSDLLSKMVSDREAFTLRERKHGLHLLSKLAKSAEVFPQSLKLEGVQCKLTDPVAAGGYAFIYKGEHERSTICIKAVRVDSRGINAKKMRAHASELTFWGHLFHPNVLPFLGIYFSEETVSRVCIVLPWMDNGNLLEYLGMTIEVPRKPLVRDVLSGLHYLHSLDIIHADLKAENVLVSANGRAMLADFGISRLSITRATNLTHVGAGTDYWKAPELLLNYEPHSCASDIWAFACTCYEIITGKIPFGEHEDPQRLKYAFKRGNITPLVPEELGTGWDADVWSMATLCWKRAASKRPGAHELLDIINGYNFLDDRPIDLEPQRKRSVVEVDYDRILNTFDEIRQSAAALKVDELSATDVGIEGLAWLRRGSKKVRELLQGPTRFLG